MAAFSQSLSETKYFREVDVHPLLKDVKNYTVPIYVGLKPKSNNLVEVGLGYATDEGVRAQLNWEKPWLNEYGHSLNAQFKVSMVQQNITFNYRIPGKDPINDYYNLQTSYENTELNDTKSKLVMWECIIGQKSWETGNGIILPGLSMRTMYKEVKRVIPYY